jgi:ABC-2 type transport system ATP-binding protein
LIEVQGLTRYYGHHAAVRNVSFRAERGEILGFLGPNGAGKTTTMRMLTCFLPPTSGTALVAGFDILDQSLEVRSRIGYLPESVPLYRDLTVSAYLNFVATLKGMPLTGRVSRIGTVMEECGVDDVQGQPIGTLSRGYRQRVGLAQALVNDPEVLILDEPTVGLDPRQIVEIRELIRRLAGERTVILSTHILPEVSLLCQRVIIINAGELISDDTPDNLGQPLKRSMVIDVTVRGARESIVPLLESTAGVESVAVITSADSLSRFHVECEPQRDAREEIASAIVAAGFGLIAMQSLDPSLEDVFVQLVTRESAGDD